MKKLNEIIKNHNVTAYGFPAFRGLADRSCFSGTPAVVSTLSAAVMADMGIYEYYSPVIPRNTVYTTTDDVLASDLDANLVSVEYTDDITDTDEIIIVSRHVGTVELLQEMYPNNTVLASVTPDDISGKNVVGTLPPQMIQYAGRFKGVSIRDFDYNKDGDLSGEELRGRLIVSNMIKVTIK